MDLNRLYSQHQIALMKAGASASLPDQHIHLDCAAHIASRIASYQRTHGAEAAGSWLGDRQPRVFGQATPLAEGALL